MQIHPLTRKCKRAMRSLRPRLELLEDRAVPALTSGFVQAQFTSGLSIPTSMTFAPDGRLFVSEKAGSLRIVQPDGTLLPTPFLQLTVDTIEERGLLGIAFDPSFATNRFLYVFYTGYDASFNPVNRVSRFTASSGDPNVVQGGSELVLLDNIPSTMGWHNGGSLHFGKDGKLYISVGESGIPDNAQLLSNLAGKILRINSNGTIPADNPFVGTPGAREEIWALGLRNPYTFAVRPSDGKTFVNDVGENTFEEVNDLQKGANYGWPTEEGVDNNNPNFIDPIHTYAHNGTGAAITGGVFQESTAFPAANRGYYFSDYIRGFIRFLNPATNQVKSFATGLSSPVDLDVSPSGSLMYLSIFTGEVFAITPTRWTLLDQDGDQYTVRLTGPGQFSLLLSDPDLDGKGPISSIKLQNTDPVRSSLSITVRKAPAGDGLVTIGSIEGPGLRSISAPKANIIGSGIDMTGPVGRLYIRDVGAAATITFGGTLTDRTSVIVHVVEDNVAFNFGPSVTSFRAARVGDGSITAPSIGTLSVRGDPSNKQGGVIVPIPGHFEADVTLTGPTDPTKPTLSSATIAGDVISSSWNVAGGAKRVIGTMTVRGSVTGSTFASTGNVGSFRSANFLNSRLYAGFTPSNPSNPFAGGTFAPEANIASFTVTSLPKQVTPAFADSFVGAPTIGRVSLKSILEDAANPYGILARDSIGRVTIRDSDFSYDSSKPTPQGVLDFQVRII